MKYRASPTVQAFMDSRAFIKGLMGPVGGGKSTGNMMELLFERALKQNAHNNVRRTKFAIVRNTSAQLKQTVKPLLDEWFVTMPSEAQGRALGQWRLTDGVFEVEMPLPDGTLLHTEFFLLAADTPDDVRRLLSLQLSAAWVEEAREIDSEVFKGLLGRVGRFPSRVAGGVTYPGVIFSTNAPMLNTFWHDMIVNPPANAEIFVQPAAVIEVDGEDVINPDAENLEFLIEGYYDNLLAANTEAWVDVYLKNKFGVGNAGQAVYKETFKRKFHVASAPLRALPHSSFPLVVGMDNGLQAAAAVMQADARGRVNMLSESFVPKDTTMGVETFLDTILIPHLLAKYRGVPRDAFTFVLDPACYQRSQVNEMTIAQAVAKRGYKAVRAITNDPERRQMAMEGLLNRAFDGGPGFVVDPSCTHFIDGMEWGFRYKKAPEGQVSTTRDKTHHSHLCEAGEYAAGYYNAQAPQAATPWMSQAKVIKRVSHMYV
jgi:hypothetical protein